jgi:hypothetical protein
MITIIQVWNRFGCEPSDQMQKYIYLQAFYWVYDNKFITKTQNFIFNSLLGLVDVVIACEALLITSNKDPNFQMQYLLKNKAVNSNNNGNCRNPECNLKGPQRHVPSECWIEFPD